MKLIPFDYAVRNLARSPSRFAAILLGNALVVLLIVAAASFVEGMRNSLGVESESENVILLATGSEESIERSEIPATTPGILEASLRGIKTAGGVSFVSPEILSALILQPEETSEEELRGIVRGITPSAFLVHERVEITEGRTPKAGANEMIAGSLTAEKLNLPKERLAIGESIWFDGQPWEIVGHFSAKGSVMDAELWTPLTDLQVATKRDGLSCVIVTLDTAEFADLDAFTKMRVDLELSAIRETAYYASLVQFYKPIRIMIWATAILIALAGILGGLNTLYSAFAARVRELGMLQSIGFSRRAIIMSLMQEAMLASAFAVLVAILIAKLTLDGIAISYSMGVFELKLTSAVLAVGGAVGLLLGIIGAIPPSIRSLRIPIPEALKSI